MGKYFDVKQVHPWDMPEFLMNGRGYLEMTADMPPEEEGFMLAMGIDNYLATEMEHEWEKDTTRTFYKIYPDGTDLELSVLMKFYKNNADWKVLKKEEVHILRLLFYKIKATQIKMTTTQEEDDNWVRLFGED